MTAPTAPLLSEIESRVLAFIAAAGGDQVGEDAILAHLFPPPAYPHGGSDAERAEWLIAERAYQDRAYSGNGVAYADCHNHTRALACIALLKAGLIREHNNGYNVGSFSIVKSLDAWRGAFVKREGGTAA